MLKSVTFNDNGCRMMGHEKLMNWLEGHLAGKAVVQFSATRGNLLNPRNRLLSSDCRDYVVTIERIRSPRGDEGYCLHHRSVRSSNWVNFIKRHQPDVPEFIGDHFTILISKDGVIQACDYQLMGNDTMQSRLFSRDRELGSSEGVDEFVEQIGQDRVNAGKFTKVVKATTQENRSSIR
jgi:hypothetical protein